MIHVHRPWVRWLAGLALVLFGSVSQVGAGTIQLIANGDFETGNLTGWTTVSQSGGSSFLVANDVFAPLSGFPTVGPAGDTYYALSDQAGDPITGNFQPSSAAL